MAILTIGLLGVAGALMVSSGVMGGLATGQAGVTRGYYVSAAAMLAQDRLEQVKRLQYSIGPPAVDQLGSGTPSGFSDEAYGAISGYPNFTRNVRVTDASPGANMKTVTVTVGFKFASSSRMREESISVSTIAAARP